MEIPIYFKYLTYLDQALWEGGIPVRRSEEITPLYVERYLGVRRDETWSAHDHWEFTCVFSGHGQLLGKQTIELSPHTICLVPPDWEHRERSEEMMDTIWIGFTGSHVPADLLDEPCAVLHPGLTVMIEEMWLLTEHRQSPMGLELDGLTAVILGRFLRLLQGSDLSVEGDLVQRAIRFLNAHFAQPISVAELAKRFGCSEGYFHRIFKQATGQTPTGYLTRIRLQHAVRWLQRSHLPIWRIAEMSGYEDAFYFSRVMKKNIGLTPSQIRDSARARRDFVTPPPLSNP